VFTHRQQLYETRLLPVYQHRVTAIQEDATKSYAEQQEEIDTLTQPHPPTLDLPQTQFTSAMEMQLSKIRERICHTVSDADAAIQLIKRYLSVRILNSCAAALNISHETTSGMGVVMQSETL